MFDAPSISKLLRLQKHLPEDLKQSSVCVAFKHYQTRSFCDEFLRIRMTSNMLQKGEKSFYRTEIFQPHRTGVQLCTFCRTSMKQYSEVLYKCQNPACGKSSSHFSGPVRGVIDIKTKFTANHRGKLRTVDFFAGYYEHTLPNGKTTESELSHGCLMILDRRYDELTLSQVLRTASIICDEFGVQILN